MSDVIIDKKEMTKATKKMEITPGKFDPLPVLKDVGIIGFIIYALWIKVDDGATERELMKAETAKLETRITVIETNYLHINSQLIDLKEQNAAILKELQQ